MSDTAATRPSQLRYLGGWVFFLLSLLLPVGGMLVPLLGLDKATSALLVGGMVVGAPEICVVAAISLWGRETFNYFLGQAKGLFRRLLPPAHVSPFRYRFGLLVFWGSALPCWLLAYFPHWLEDKSRVAVLVGADFAFIFSFYILGGDFWGKLRALFTPTSPSGQLD